MSSLFQFFPDCLSSMSPSNTIRHEWFLYLCLFLSAACHWSTVSKEQKLLTPKKLERIESRSNSWWRWHWNWTIMFLYNTHGSKMWLRLISKFGSSPNTFILGICFKKKIIFVYYCFSASKPTAASLSGRELPEIISEAPHGKRFRKSSDVSQCMLLSPP